MILPFLFLKTTSLKHSKSRFAIGLKITIRYFIVVVRNIGIPSRPM